MKILRATHMGWCFGVRAAVELVERHAEREPVTVLGALVHNRAVNESLEERGVRFSDRLDEVRAGRVVISAHGTSDAARQEIRERAPTALDATCPLVRVAHRAALDLAREGYHPVIIGQRDHVEVRGLTGDLAEFDVVLTPTDVAQLAPRPRFGVVAQTTQPGHKVSFLLDLIGRRFPEADLRFVDTVCQPTKQRQSAAVDLAQRCDAVVVVGGRKSNNTEELARTCERFCPRVHRVEGAGDLDPEWFAGAGVVGITAGTSTPDETIEAVEQRLKTLVEEKDELLAAR